MKRTAALLLLALPGAAAASTVEANVTSKQYGSPAACEEALRKLHAAAVAERTAADQNRQDRLRIEPPHRDGDGHLLFWTLYDGTVRAPEAVLPGEATDEYRCKGALLEHAAYWTGGGVELLPPPPPPEQPQR